MVQMNLITSFSDLSFMFLVLQVIHLLKIGLVLIMSVSVIS